MEFITIKREIKTEVDKPVVEYGKGRGKVKRKRKDISLETKLKIIEAVDRGGRKKKDIAKEFKIPSTTLSSLLKYRDKIIETRNSGAPLSSRKRVRGAKHSELDKELTLWFCQRRDNNLSINGPLLREKAEEIANKLGIVGFKCSNGWLQRMKARNIEIYGTKRTYKRNDSIEFEYIDAEEFEEGDDCQEHEKSLDQNGSIIGEEVEQQEQHVTKFLISIDDFNREGKCQSTSHEEFLLEELAIETPADVAYPSERPNRDLPIKSEAFNALDILKQVVYSPDVKASSEVISSFDVLQKFIQESYPKFVQLKINNYFTKLK